MPRDPYELLGVDRDASVQEIKKAFRQLARELHPDVNAHDPDAEEKFKGAAEAYEILSDAERRATYDRYGHEGLRSGGFAPNFEGFGSISDLFDAFFGSAFGAARDAVDDFPFAGIAEPFFAEGLIQVLADEQLAGLEHQGLRGVLWRAGLMRRLQRLSNLQRDIDCLFKLYRVSF